MLQAGKVLQAEKIVLRFGDDLLCPASDMLQPGGDVLQSHPNVWGHRRDERWSGLACSRDKAL